ncbi:hypothetical protein HYC85_016889 [Camellia sinensis]|uniref:Uncharacterized protein n=1 Tax=Camellia sinensis TaxID=4442 RepID=A0A7J7H337_CAMSI|nr:hypothetical protein HYC85_016889 [Camellia sinensis]
METLKIKQENIVVIDDDIPGGGGGGLFEEEEEEETVKVVEVKEEAVIDPYLIWSENSVNRVRRFVAFEGGKKHLLKNIKRRKHNPQNVQQQGVMRPCLNSANFGIETELEKLRNDRMKMKMEIMKLKQQQENTESYLAAVKEGIGNTENKQQDILIFMAKAFSNLAFFHQFIHPMRPKKELCNGQIAKKRRLAAAPQSNEDQVTNKNQEEFTTNDSEVEKLFSASLDFESRPSQDQKINASPGPMSPDLSYEDYILWEKLLEDEVICEKGSAQVEAELVQHQSKIVLQLENLIAKPPDWACYVKDLVEQLSCLESKWNKIDMDGCFTHVNY